MVKTPKRTWLKWMVRLLILAAALFFVIGGPLPAWMGRIVPAFSPLTLFAESISQRTWYAGLFWSIPPLVVLLLAVFKGRFFCQWICPLGTLYALPVKISRKTKILQIRINALIFWIILGGAVIGAPLLLWLDPLSTVSRLGVWTLGPGLLIPLFLLFSFFQPQVWCTHLCSLGYCFDLANRKTSKAVFRRDRRQFIAGLGLGAGAAAILPALRRGSGQDIGKNQQKSSVLPPGAIGNFAEICTRCYACVNICPVEIIKVKKGGPLNELAMPELVFEEYGCEESCNLCAQVCPTGAIRSIHHDRKWRTQIGVAKVEREKCLGWTDNQYCMVCDEYCPYNAITTKMRGNIPCPIVDPTLCRGCGACEGACPATREGKAIFVHPVQPQRQLKGLS